MNEVSNESSEPVAVTDGDATVLDETGTPPPDDELARLAHIVESVLFAAAAPVPLRRLVDLLDGPTSKEVQAALARLKEHYAPGQRGIQLQEVAGGYQFRTARENAEWVRAVFREKPSRLGRAALETLAIIAYKQPVTRAEVEAIRGVDVDGVLTTLLSRRLIKISGRKDAVGRPLLYTTTPEFLETFGLKDLNELPSLRELGPAPEGEDGAIASQTEPEETVAASAGAAAVEQPVAEQPAAEEPTAREPAAREPAAEPSAAEQTGAVGTGALTEDSEPRRDRLAAESGGADSGTTGVGERAGCDPVGDEGGPTQGSDHD